MATLNVLFEFTSDAQGFITVATSGSSTIWAWSSTGGNPTGKLVGTGNTTGSPGDVGNVVKTATFEQLGVPAGATITGISAGTFHSYCNQYPAGDLSLTIGPLSITHAVAGTVALTDSKIYTGESVAWSSVTGSGSATGLSLPSTDSIDIKVAYDLTRGINSPAGIISLDNLGFTITYDPLTSNTGTMAAVEGNKDGFAGDVDIRVAGSLSASEAGADDFTGNGDVGVAGSLAVGESGADGFVGVGTTAQFVDVLFPFNSNFDGFVDDLASGRWSWQSSGGNPGGRLQAVTAGAGDFQGNLVHAGTYQSLGVPSGANITGFELGKFDAIANAFPGTTTHLNIGPLQIGGQTLVAEHVFTGTTSWTTFSQSGSITGLSIPASTEADLKVGYWIARGTGIGNPQESLDNVSLRIFYAMPGPITGSLGATESGSDGFAGSGAVRVAGSLSASETGADGFAGSVGVGVAGSLGGSEAGADVFSGALSLRVSGSLAVVEPNQDTFSSSGSLPILGSLFTFETGADVFAADGILLAPGSMAAFETGPDVFAGIGAVGVAGSLSGSEAGVDVFAGDGSVEGPITGSMAAVESGQDIMSGSLVTSIVGSMAAVEVGGIS